MNSRYQNFLEEKRLFDAEAERIFKEYFCSSETANKIVYDEKEVTVFYSYAFYSQWHDDDVSFPVDFLFKPKEELDTLVDNLKTQRQNELFLEEEERSRRIAEEKEKQEIEKLKELQEKYGKV